MPIAQTKQHGTVTVAIHTRTTSQTLYPHGKLQPHRKKALVALGFVDQWWYCRDQWYLPQVSPVTGSWFSGKWACIIALFQSTECMNVQHLFFFSCHNNSPAADTGQNDTTLQFAPHSSRCQQQRHQLPLAPLNDNWHHVFHQHTTTTHTLSHPNTCTTLMCTVH